MYVPEKGVPHINCTYAGLAFGFTGANLAGITVSQVSEPGTAPADTVSPLMRSMLYDALSLRGALGTVNNAYYPPANVKLIIGDGRNEKRAVKLWFDDTGGLVEKRYDLFRDDFDLEKVGLIYDASGDDARQDVWQILQENLPVDSSKPPYNLRKVTTMAATVPAAMVGKNLLNVVYDFAGSNFVVYVAIARDGQEAFQDYLDQVWVQGLLP